ncbi:MAG: hypothetical protein HYX24_03400 [Candidatus Aenigmarchaeota archaeon]|nr:hypothetical protein [Candidatus Aenigmarchaeota archaeon]
MAPTIGILAWGLVGGILRIIISYLRNYSFGWNNRKATITILSALFVSAVAAILVESGNPKVLVIAGFGGIDALNAIYRSVMRKETGISAGAGPDLVFGTGSSYPEWMNERQRNALNYMAKYGRIANDDYQRLNKVSDRSARYDLELLVRKGMAKKTGRGRGIYYVPA